MHIRGLIIGGFFMRHAPNLIKEKKIKQLRTPLIVLKKNNKIKHFFFNFDDFNEWSKSNDSSKFDLDYMKGLGSWEKDDLIELFANNPLEYFIEDFEWTEDCMKTVHQWLSSTEVQSRKDYLTENTFDMFKV